MRADSKDWHRPAVSATGRPKTRRLSRRSSPPALTIVCAPGHSCRPVHSRPSWREARPLRSRRARPRRWRRSELTASARADRTSRFKEGVVVETTANKMNAPRQQNAASTVEVNIRILKRTPALPSGKRATIAEIKANYKQSHRDLLCRFCNLIIRNIWRSVEVEYVRISLDMSRW